MLVECGDVGRSLVDYYHLGHFVLLTYRFFLSLLFSEDRIPVFLVGRADRFLAFAPAIIRRCSGSWIAVRGLGCGFG